jgi:iron complex outermembrane recepter protein
MHKIVILIFGFLSPIVLFAQKSSISIIVLNAQQQPVSGATVKIAGTNSATATNDSGIAEITGLQAGKYKLIISAVGLEEKKQPFTLVNGQHLQLPAVQLQENVSALSAVTVYGGKSSKYVETAPSIGLRLNVPLIEVPQNIAVTTKQTMLNWGILSTSELSRTVSGVVKNYGDFNDFSFTIRGTNAFNNIFRNGVGGYWWNQQEDAAMIERIEFVKGPAGFMIGNSEPGGLVNIITKQPTRQRIREVEIGAGSYNLWRTSIDLGGAFSEKSKFSYRLAAGAQRQNGMVDFTKANRYFISPSLRYNFKEKTYIQAEFNRMGGYSLNGTAPTIPSVNNQLFALPNNFAVSDPNIEGLKTFDNYSRISFVHQFTNGWRINAQTAYINGLYGGDAMYMTGFNETQDTIYRGYNKTDWRNNLKSAQVFVDGTIQQGKKIEHKILAGLDFGHTAVATNYGILIDSTGKGLPLAVNNPSYFISPDSLKNLSFDDPSNWGSQWLSLYVQDHIKINSKWIVTLAGRANISKAWASYDNNTVRDFVITPRLGFTYLFNKNTSAFVVYDECYIPQTGRKEDNTAAQPLTGSNKEIGFKSLLLKNKLSFTISAYQTTKNNILVQNPNTGLYVERGQITAKGIEADLTGTLSKHITVNANFTYTDARITQDANPEIVGIANQGTPTLSSNILLRYKVAQGVMKGLSAGVGASYMGRKGGIWPEWNDPKDRDKQTPAYWLFDCNVGYETRRFTLMLNVFNLFNKQYISSGWYTSSFNATPGYWGYSAGLPINFRTSLYVRL